MVTIVTYGIFGLDIEAIFALMKLVIAILFIIGTIMVRSRGTWTVTTRWMVIAVSLAFAWFGFWTGYAQLTADGATFLARYWWADLDQGRLQIVLLFQFAVYFMVRNRRISIRQKCVLFGGYAYVAATVWVPAFTNPSSVSSGAIATTFGWTPAPGTLDTYLAPYGIDIFSSQSCRSLS
jgi:hypothetical protein